MFRLTVRSSSCVLALATIVGGLGATGSAWGQIDVVVGDPQDWPMYNHDPEGTRWAFAENQLHPGNVGDLQILWSFPTAGPVAGTPIVVNDRIYAGDGTGMVYALRRDGQVVWQTMLDILPSFWTPKITASALVTNRTVIIGDLTGRIHGLDVNTGEVRWIAHPNPHPFATIFGSPTMVGRHVAIGISSGEEFVAGAVPGYQPSFRGSLVLLDPSDGSIVWQTYLITEAEHAAGASGSPIWSTPTYDRASRTIFVTTGNNYSQPTTGTSDAFIALDARTGAIKWINQRTEDDEWTFAFGDSTEEHPDFDIGDSPQLYRMNGRLVVSAGQKSGFLHVLDAATGQELATPIQVAPDGTLGGLFADSAYANGVVYVNGSDWPDVVAGGPPNKGIISAVSADGAQELWRFETPFSPNISGVAVANGVLYFQSSFNGTLFALNAGTGALLAQVPTGGVSSGPSISRGRIYVGAGDALSPGFNPSLPLGPGAIVALGLPE